MPNGGMPVFTLIATGWRHQNMRIGKYCFTKKALYIYDKWSNWGHLGVGWRTLFKSTL